MSALRALIPAALRRDLSVLRSLAPASWGAYLGQRLARARGVPEPAMRAEGVRSVLFICHGNIMRSAAADALLRRHLAGATEVAVRSAGTHARAGKQADPRAAAAAAAIGVDLGSHAATPVDAPLVQASDLIFVMDFANEAEMRARFPEAAGRLHLLGALARAPGELLEIRDPYTGGSAESTVAVERIARAVEVLAAALARSSR